MLCKGVGVGLTLDPVDGEVGVIVSLHDEEGDDNAASFIVLEPRRAAEIALNLMTQAATGEEILNEIMNTPMDDRPAQIARIVERMNSGQN